MIVTEKLFEIEDQTEKLVQAILASDSIVSYKINRQSMYNSKDVQEKQKTFLDAKDSFERIEAYGNHAPDFRTKQRAVRQAKRALDVSEEVAEFRFSETEVQTILDLVGMAVAKTISDDIKVDAGNPFFEKGKHSGCGGSCHAS
ncbi:YlbF family regulator [Enterococcus crotali]|uniref:YlbF family regulator n=1 Tax=Enterococcus crotali TaxID=1453587 RepID=UPI00046FD3AD|nr:YlbF family regulator [Enterococcus crotali]